MSGQMYVCAWGGGEVRGRMYIRTCVFDKGGWRADGGHVVEDTRKTFVL